METLHIKTNEIFCDMFGVNEAVDAEADSLYLSTHRTGANL